MDNYANDNTHNDDIFGDVGCEDIAQDENVDGLHNSEDNTLVEINDIHHQATSSRIRHPHSTIGHASSSRHPTRNVDRLPLDNDLSNITNAGGP